MRLWTIHPMFLDSKGLVALWRESLLARAVLQGKTVGYVHHPQLTRFREQTSPTDAINEYLAGVFAESRRRGFKFDSRKLRPAVAAGRIRETRGQLEYEWDHLLKKLRVRDSDLYRRNLRLEPKPHPMFEIVPGPARSWEHVA